MNYNPDTGRLRKTNLKIWQHNINKSGDCQHDLISSGKLTRWDIDVVALQEPAINSYGQTVASKDWKTIYPSGHAIHPEKTRSVILVRDNLLTDGWEQIEFPSGDVTAIRIKGSWGKLTLFNIYNDCNHDNTLELLATYHKRNYKEILGSAETQSKHHLMWVGDFNRHHPCWDSPDNNGLFMKEATARAEILIQLIAEIGLDLALPAGTPTHEHNITKQWSRLDQVFVTEHTLDALMQCEALPMEQGLNTDHFPVISNLDINIDITPKKAISNFRDVDWKEFRKVLGGKINKWGVPNFIRSQAMLDRECDKLTTALQETIGEVVPEVILGPQAKRWWTKELTNLRKDMLKIRRKICKKRADPNNTKWAQFRDARRRFGRELEKTKKNHWRDWLEKAMDPDLWTAHKYISAPPGDCGKTRIPDLMFTDNEGQHRASTNEDKGKILAKTFFPTKPVATEKDVQMIAQNPICKADPISREQIRRALARLRPFKAPGPDRIPNIVLSKCADLIENRLWHIYTAIMEKGWYYVPWKSFTTVVLRKPGKPRYDIPKAYRPIALLNTMGKVLTAIIAEQLTYYTERYELLPPLHFGGRPARTTSDAIQYLVYKIKDAWRKKQVISVLFLDIEGAFPNAVNEKLITNLTRRRVPTAIVQFMRNMLKERKTRLKFDDHESGYININNGIGQGDPLSMVLYQYYNADLLDVLNTSAEFAAAYVDDTILVATAKTFEDSHNMLANMMTRKDRAMQWAKEHNSKFELSKLALLDFAHKSKKVCRPPLRIADTTIEASKSIKYLGIYLDQHLNWKEQEAYATRKGTAWAAQIRRAVRPDWGLTPKLARCMYTSVALPRILYAADIWAPPEYKQESKAKPTANRRFTKKLASIQRAGTLAIVGGLRTSPTDTLCTHVDILPAHLELDKACHKAAVRMATLPHSHPVTKIFRKVAKLKVKRHRSPLHCLASAFGTSHEAYETTIVAGRNPALMGKQPFRMEIADSKDDSKVRDEQAPEHVKIYLDGSMHDSNVGAAAVLTRNGKTQEVLHYHLGPSSDHTVFEAELVGILMGLHLVGKAGGKNITFAIGVDNQAAIKSLSSKFNKPGHYLAAEAHQTAAKLCKTKGKKYSLSIRWTAGHTGIPGNEEADVEAKKAAEGATSNLDQLPKILEKPLKRSKSAALQEEGTVRKERWRQDWIESPRYAKFKHIDPSLPSRRFLKLISNPKISRADTSKIFQIRSGHVPLNAYLHRFKRKESAQCPACGAQKETPQHFLLECPAYTHERRKLKQRRGELEAKFAELVTSEKKTIALAQYIQATGRFVEDRQERVSKGAVKQTITGEEE